MKMKNISRFLGGISVFYVISYDIVDDKRRKKLSDFLESFAIRVQCSVFETEMESSRLEKLVAQIQKLIDQKEDTVRIYPLSRSLRRQIITIGNDKGHYYENDVIII
jgi:CRISPR-associated protein Cas2